MMAAPARAVLMVAMLGLAACTAGPDFLAPPPPDTLSYTEEGDSTLRGDQRILSGQAVAAAWWRQFESPLLDRLVTQALSDNHTLAAANAALDQAREAVIAESGALDPHLSLDGTAGRLKYGVALFGPSNFHIPPFTYYTVGPSLDYRFDFAGREKRAIEEQQARADYQGYQRDLAALLLAGDVVAEALSSAAARTQLAILESVVASDEKTQYLVETSLQAGAATRADVLQAQARVASDRTLIPALQQQLSVARHALSILIGKAPTEAAPPFFDLDQFTLPATLPLTVPSELVHARPDIRAAEAQLHTANAALGVASANLYPQITLSAGLTLEALSPLKLFQGSALANSLAGGLSQPLFDGGTLAAEKRAAMAATLTQRHLYEQTVIAAFGEVADALRALDNDAEELKARRATLELTEQSVALTRRSYALGNAGTLAVLEGERQRLQALLAYRAAQARRFQDTAQFFVALGGGGLQPVVHAPQ